MSKTLVELLGKDFGSITSLDHGCNFAQNVIEEAQKQHIPLESIPELKYADLNGDGKITEKEIAALIYVTHENRTGSEFKIISSGTEVRDGHAVRNLNYDPRILASDIQAMADSSIVKKARAEMALLTDVPNVKDLLQAIDRETINTLKAIKGGVEVNENTRGSSSSISGNRERNVVPTR